MAEPILDRFKTGVHSGQDAELFIAYKEADASMAEREDKTVRLCESAAR
jgi:hypothetical protein